MANFLLGITFLFDGFQLLTTKGVKRYVIIPVLINILLFVTAFFLLRYFMGEFNAWVMHFLPAWLQWLAYLLWILFFISFFILFVYTFVAIANLISAPFNSLLSEKIEMHLAGDQTIYSPSASSFLEIAKSIPRTIGRQFGVLVYYLPRALLLFILFFIPVIQTIAPLLWIAFNAWFLTLTYVDYPTDNHRIPLDTVRVWIEQNRSISLGFGIAVLLVSLVPIVNLFAVPAAVAGATKYWLIKR